MLGCGASRGGTALAIIEDTDWDKVVFPLKVALLDDTVGADSDLAVPFMRSRVKRAVYTSCWLLAFPFSRNFR